MDEDVRAYIKSLEFINATLENELKRLRESGVKLAIRLSDEILHKNIK